MMLLSISRNLRRIIVITAILNVILNSTSSAMTPEEHQKDVQEKVAKIMCLVWKLAGPAMLIMMGFGGVMIVLWGDDPQKRQQGKSLFYDAMIGGVCIVALREVAEQFGAGFDKIPDGC